MAYEVINKNKQLNFQINRVLTYGEMAGDHDKIVQNLSNIKNIEDWYLAWLKIAADEEAKKAYLRSAYAYRMAEFFLKENHPEKQKIYDCAVKNFYLAFEQLSIPYLVNAIPYKGTYLHSVYMQASDSKTTILVCGGYDSFIEEFIPVVSDILKQGYSLVLFEGDGQGKTLKNGLPFIHNWEEPTAAVLDYYKIDHCPMIGISWGGYLAMRAAAFDHRISAVAAYDVADNGYEIMTSILPPIIKTLVCNAFEKNNKKRVNNIINFICKKNILADWAFSQGQYITHTQNPYDFYQKLKLHTLSGVSDKITQDCLLLAGEKDHYIPCNQYDRLKANLPKASSVQGRLFTANEGGEQHCQIGNHQLALNEIIHWLESLHY